MQAAMQHKMKLRSPIANKSTTRHFFGLSCLPCARNHSRRRGLCREQPDTHRSRSSNAGGRPRRFPGIDRDRSPTPDRRECSSSSESDRFRGTPRETTTCMRRFEPWRSGARALRPDLAASKADGCRRGAIGRSPVLATRPRNCVVAMLSGRMPPLRQETAKSPATTLPDPDTAWPCSACESYGGPVGASATIS